MEDDVFVIGPIKQFDPKKGFGFSTPPKPLVGDVLLHVSVLEGALPTASTTRVAYVLKQHALTGRLRASKWQVVA